MLVSRDQVTRALLTHEWTEMNPVEQGVAQVEKELEKWPRKGRPPAPVRLQLLLYPHV